MAYPAFMQTHTPSEGLFPSAHSLLASDALYGSDEFFDHWLGWLRAGVTRMHAGPLQP
jgi:hypothetical protein